MINLIAQAPAAGVGFIVGAFTPAIGRKIKALFVKESKVVVAKVESEAAAIEKKL